MACVSLAAISCAGATQTQVRLLLSADQVRPGDTATAGVLLKMPAKWHTYWKSSGDSGGPTTVEWTLPEGVTAGEIQWPTPEKYTVAGLTTYVYHDEVLLQVPLKFASTVPPGPVELKARVSWLECAEICLPGAIDLRADAAVGERTKPSANLALFETWRKMLPRPEPPFGVRSWWEGAGTDDTRPAVIEWAAGDTSAPADFYSYPSESYEVATATEIVKRTGTKIQLRKAVRKLAAEWPTQLQGILVVGTKSSTVANAVTLRLEAEPSATPDGAWPPGAVNPVERRPLGIMLIFAFLGGLILNIMPCVLPVIALKVLGFVNQSKDSPKTVRKHGLVYGVGVVVSFLVLAGAVIAVQQAGRAASWGMQFQNSYFLVAMTVLVTLVALNLFGVFEVTLSSGAMGAASQLASKDGTAGAFFNGVLATALATPCTAPFLAPALGYAFTQPAPIIALMFLTIGLGLAVPYALLSFFPEWSRFLPKPGAWMLRLKVAMGFPMLAAAIWLFTLTAPHFGRGGALWFGVFLVLLACVAWIWGEFVQRGQRRRGLACGFSAAILAVAYFVVLEGQLHWRSPASLVKGVESRALKPGGIEWLPWSVGAVAKAQAEGLPVLVDFTADWCVTCQANKKTSLEVPSVRAKLKEMNAVALLGDYTRKDDAITAELQRWGRAGVPLVLVYPGDPAKGPVVLPEVLTPGIVLNALKKAARNTKP